MDTVTISCLIVIASLSLMMGIILDIRSATEEAAAMLSSNAAYLAFKAKRHSHTNCTIS